MWFQWHRNKARWAATASWKSAKRLWRRYTLLVTLLYPYLKWVVGAVVVAPMLGLIGAYVGRGVFDQEWGVEFGKLWSTLPDFAAPYQYLYLVLLAVVPVLIASAWVGHRRQEKSRQLRDAFGLYKPAEELSREDTGSGDRPFFGTYYPRKAVEDEPSEPDKAIQEFSEEDLAEHLRDGQSFLLTELIGAGKSLTLFEVLRRMGGWVVVSPSVSLSFPTEEVFALLRGQKVVVLLDNLATYARENYDLPLFCRRVGEGTRARFGVAAACRDGSDYTLAVAGSGNHVAYFAEGLLKLRLRPMAGPDKKALATAVGLDLKPNELRLYRQPGDITMRGQAKAMRDRFQLLSDATKELLYAMKLLDAGGISSTRSRLDAVVTGVFHRSITQDALEHSLENLWEQGFLEQKPSRERVNPHFGYLAWAVSYGGSFGSEDDHWGQLAATLEQVRDVDALVDLGIALGRRGDLSATLLALERAVRVDPTYAEAHFQRGYALARLGNLDEALVANGRALELRPDFAKARINRGHIFSRLGRLPDALEEYQQAIQLRPGSGDAQVNRAVVLARLGRYDEAIKEFTTSFGLSAKNYKTYVYMGTALSRQDAFEQALGVFDYALQLRPNKPQAHFYRGITLARMGRPIDALAAIDRAIELGPDYPEAHYQRGRTFAVLGKYAAALPDLDRAIELRPDYAEAHCDRGSALANLGRHDEALRAVDVALTLRPEFAKAHFARGFVLSTIKGYDRGRLEQALQEYTEAVRLRPDHPEAHRKRGFILGQLGFDEEALAAFNHAIELRPGYAEALYGKARTLCFLARRNPPRFPLKEAFGEAMDLLERTVAIDNSIIARISRDRSAFRDLRRDPEYGPRLYALVWGSTKNHDGSSTSFARSRPT